jgi:hypothetical protein
MRIKNGVYQHLWNAQLHDSTTTETSTEPKKSQQ